MSSTHGDDVPPAAGPPPSQPPSWNPLVGSGGDWPPADQPQAYQGQSYGAQPYQPQLYPPQTQPPPYQQPGYPPQPLWVPPVPVYPYAVWIRRVAAFLIDFAPTYVAMIPFYVGYGMFYARILRLSTSGQSEPEQVLDDLTGTPLVLMGVGLVLMLAAFGWQWYNRWLTAGRTGQSMGKRVLNTKLVAEINGQPIGAVNAFLRDLLHTLDGLAYIGYLWPLWDGKRQTFADMIMKTVVVDLRVHPDTPPARSADHSQLVAGPVPPDQTPPVGPGGAS